jgi:hypothetical protein
VQGRPNIETVARAVAGACTTLTRRMGPGRRSTGHWSCGQAHDEPCTRPVVFYGQRPAVVLHDLAGDGESEAGARGVRCPGVVQSSEAFKDALPVLGSDAGTVISDRDLDGSVVFSDCQRDGGGGMPFGVLEQVADGSRQLPWIAFDLAG